MKTFIICGLIKNNEKFMNSLKNKINQLYKLKNLKLIKIIIYENDSTDNTLQILKSWNFNELIIISEKNINKGSRVKNITYGRNRLLNYVKNNNINPDFLVMLDMDDVLKLFNPFILDNIIHIKKNWSVLGGNSYIYYDLFALRLGHKYNNNLNYLKFNKKDRLKYIYFKIPRNSGLIKVNSCFNGICIYKYDIIKDCYYKGDEKLCEHVFLHNLISKKGGNIYIYPKLITGPHYIMGKYNVKVNNILHQKNNKIFFNNKILF